MKGELRFGTRGSLSVDLGAGTFYDHEAGIGGGVLDFVQIRKNLDKSDALAWLQAQGHIEKPKQKATIVATYDYVAANGDPLFQVVRFAPKDFRQRRSDGNGGWLWNMKNIQRVLYRLPAIASLAPGSRIYVVEGEKAADGLVALGLIATCSPGGANKWRNEYADPIRGLDAVILPDNDDPGRQHAAMVAKSLNGIAKQVRTLTLPDLPEKGDVADWIAAGGTRERLDELVEALVQPEQPDPPHHEDDLETAIARLAALPVTRYELVRQDEAKRLKVRASFLDKMVAQARGADDAQDDQQGRPLNLPVPEPWPEPVNGAQLLADLRDFFAKHAFLPRGAPHALALWTMHTHTFEAFTHSPRLHVRGIVKNSGKTTVLDLLEMVCCRALPAANVTTAACSAPSKWPSPHCYSMRLTPSSTKPRSCAVSSTPDTSAAVKSYAQSAMITRRACSRSSDHRHRRHRRPPRHYRRQVHHHPYEARTEGGTTFANHQGRSRRRCRARPQIVRWALDHEAQLADTDPDMGELFNRQADNWRPLFVIADIAGGTWPELVRKTADALIITDDGTETLGVKLLADIRFVFSDAKGVTIDLVEGATITSADLVNSLVKLDGRPWAEFGRAAKPITQNRLARMLAPFKVIPHKVGPRDARQSGYILIHFLDAFARHLPPA